MTKSQYVTLALVAAGGIALASVVAWPSGPSPQEIARLKERQELGELLSLKSELDKRGGHKRQLRQGTVTCKYKSGFDELAAFNSPAPEIVSTFECRVWDWPEWLQTDPMKADRQFIYVRLPYHDERWHWAKRSSIANYGDGIPQP